MSGFIHPTALIENDVSIGPNTRIWDHVHIRHSTSIGANCIVGEKSHISYAVQIGNLVKINAFVYVCTGTVIEDGVMLSAGVIFTNDRFPRAASPDLKTLLSSDPTSETGTTVVRQGATIGAGAIVGPNVTIGQFATIGMGSVVTADVRDFQLCYGTPARHAGYVCRCGQPLIRFDLEGQPLHRELECRACRRTYLVSEGRVSEAMIPSGE